MPVNLATFHSPVLKMAVNIVSSLPILAMSAFAQSITPQDRPFGGLPFDFPKTKTPERMNISVDSSLIDLALRKVHDYRPSFDIHDDWSIEGPSEVNITRAVDHWKNYYSWNDIQAEINEKFEHYATSVPGNGNYEPDIPIHFLHHRSSNVSSVPLLLLHGWPSTSLEWANVIEPLTQHGNQSFHIVAPDLPGFGFSPAPTQPLGPREMGKAFDALMKQLGYETYGVVSTDLGWVVGMWMVHDVHGGIIGHFCDFWQGRPDESDLTRYKKNETTPEENAVIEAGKVWSSLHSVYSMVHGQKPQALAIALSDSPVGLLGWYWDVNYATSDGYAYSFEELITDTLMLWIPGVYNNIRAYREIFKVKLCI